MGGENRAHNVRKKERGRSDVGQLISGGVWQGLQLRLT